MIWDCRKLLVMIHNFDNRSTNASAESFNAKIKSLDLNLGESKMWTFFSSD